MLYASDFRKIARESLYGNWGVGILSGFVASILGAMIFGGSPSVSVYFTNDNARERIVDILNSGYGSFFLPFLSGVWSVIVIWGLIKLIIGGAMTLGYAKFNSNIIYRKNPDFLDIFSQFQRLGTAFLMQLLRGVYIFLWSLLLVIPGIIASFSYSMTPYVMLEYPEMSANEAIGYSKQLMIGNKWRLFCLDLSFIGWAILCLFSFGIGYLWLLPYIEASNAAFYREITKQH